MGDQDKITIIEGPPPTFELDNDPWLAGLTEGPAPSQVAMCRVRAANGPSLVERCYRAWRDGHSISLEYRNEDGLTQLAPIVAARWAELAEGHVLILWLRLEQGEIEVEIELGIDDIDEDFDEPEDSDVDPTS